MIIKKMTATFGGLNKAVLEPAPGLTVIHAPNEGGKSTWAGFLRAMLYGINTRERDKEGYLAEKNRYTPWSGAPMEGELQLIWRGEEITLRRFAKKTNPFGGFEAVYTATGDPVPGLTADNVGETLIGGGREMYERSGFVGQGSTAVIGGAELERRIASLAATGEEEVSFTQTQRTLKDWLNRRRANRANGLLPELDGQILEIRERMAELERAKEDLDRLTARQGELEREQKELTAELDIHRRIRQQQLDRRYAEAKQRWQAAEAAVPEIGKHPVFGAMSAKEAWQFAQEAVEDQREAETENRRLEEERAKVEETCAALRGRVILWTALLALALVAVAVSIVLRKWLSVFLLGASAITCGMNLLRVKKLRRNAEAELDDFDPVPIPDAGDILEQAAAYRESLAKAEQARAAADAAKRLMDELAAQGGREFTTLEFLHTPARPMAETAARLRMVEDELARNRRMVDMNQGKLNTMGDLAELYSEMELLNARRAERQREFDAITIAMEALSSANDALRQRFSPELNRQAGELFARLTGGKYADLGLTRTFEASATPAGEIMPRSALALSRGTAEQLYLAVRLAVCNMTLGGEERAPLLLDDALVNFDDKRMELALELLRELGEERQILLFSCHRREAEWAERRGVAVCPLQSERE